MNVRIKRDCRNHTVGRGTGWHDGRGKKGWE